MNTWQRLSIWRNYLNYCITVEQGHQEDDYAGLPLCELE